MSRFPAHPHVRFCRPSSAQSGFTLVEVFLSIGIFSLIVLGVLAIYTSVVQQKNTMLAATDVATIRGAVSRWAADGNAYKADGPFQWSFISDNLPRRLGNAAASETSATLSKANPWAGDYIFRATSREPSKWTLQVQNVPENLRDVLRKNLYDFDQNIELTPRGCTQFCVGFDEE